MSGIGCIEASRRGSSRLIAFVGRDLGRPSWKIPHLRKFQPPVSLIPISFITECTEPTQPPQRKHRDKYKCSQNHLLHTRSRRQCIRTPSTKCTRRCSGHRRLWLHPLKDWRSCSHIHWVSDKLSDLGLRKWIRRRYRSIRCILRPHLCHGREWP